MTIFHLPSSPEKAHGGGVFNPRLHSGDIAPEIFERSRLGITSVLVVVGLGIG